MVLRKNLEGLGKKTTLKYANTLAFSIAKTCIYKVKLQACKSTKHLEPFTIDQTPTNLMTDVMLETESNITLQGNYYSYHRIYKQIITYF